MKFSKKISTERICEICGKKREAVQINTRHTDLNLTLCKMCLLTMLDGFNSKKESVNGKNMRVLSSRG